MVVIWLYDQVNVINTLSNGNNFTEEESEEVIDIQILLLENVPSLTNESTIEEALNAVSSLKRLTNRIIRGYTSNFITSASNSIIDSVDILADMLLSNGAKYYKLDFKWFISWM